MKRYTNVARAVFERPWAILPSTLDLIAEIVEMRMAGEQFTPEEIRERVGTEAGREPLLAVAGGSNANGGAVAVLPIYGVIMPKATLFSEMSGGTSLQRLTRAFREAVNDPGISAIVFDIDSPGGQADGLEELATEIRASRGRKPIVSVANHMMCSAAYYLGAQADEIVAAPGADVGSIGVLMKHVEVSRAEDAAGITVNLIQYGRFKTEISPHKPLSDEARAHVQSLVDAAGDLFVNAVAKGRGITAAAVRKDFGEGRWFEPKEAMRRGMVDRIDSLDATIARMLKSGRGRSLSALQEQELEASIRLTDFSTLPHEDATVEPTEEADEDEVAADQPSAEEEPAKDGTAAQRTAAALERARWEFEG